MTACTLQDGFRCPAILCNPLSGRCRHNLQELRAVAASITAAEYREACTPVEVGAAVSAFLNDGCDLLVIIGGDGMLAMVVTALYRSHVTVPSLVIVPGGTTNTVALDVGMQGKNPAKVLRRLQQCLSDPGAVEALTSCERAALKVDTSNAPPEYGFVFGLGALAAVIERFGKDGNRAGLTGEVASFGAFSKAISQLVAGRYSGVLKPTAVAIRVDGRLVEKQDYLLILVSTLDRLLMGLTPYWGRENAPVHYTAINCPPRYLRRLLPSIFRGRPRKKLTVENGYFSANVRMLEFMLDGLYVLDGEVHDTHGKSDTLFVSAMPPLHFLQL